MAESVPFDRVADCYDASRGGPERARAMAALLGSALPADGTVLEVGVGTGIVADAVRSDTRAVLGIDLAPAMAAHARERLGGVVAVGDGTALPVAEASVDAAYLVWVLHLVGDPQAVLADVRRVVRPGGRVLAVPTSWAGFGPPGERDGELEALQARLGVLRQDIASPATVAEWFAAAGLVDIERTEQVQQRQQTPAETAQLIEQRAWSMLWDVDEATWAEVVSPVLADLRRLPDPDRPRTISQTVTLVSARRT